MSDMTMILLLIPVLAVCIALYLSPWWVRQLWPRVRWCLAEKQRVRAKLLELQAREGLRLRGDGWISLYDEEVFQNYYAVFKADDGCQYTMVISKAQYWDMFQGTTGILTRKGNRFISFEPEK